MSCRVERGKRVGASGSIGEDPPASKREALDCAESNVVVRMPNQGWLDRVIAVNDWPIKDASGLQSIS